MQLYFKEIRVNCPTSVLYDADFNESRLSNYCINNLSGLSEVCRIESPCHHTQSTTAYIPDIDITVD